MSCEFIIRLNLEIQIEMLLTSAIQCRHEVGTDVMTTCNMLLVLMM
jgi:hypothetical protein